MLEVFTAAVATIGAQGVKVANGLLCFLNHRHKLLVITGISGHICSNDDVVAFISRNLTTIGGRYPLTSLHENSIRISCIDFLCAPVLQFFFDLLKAGNSICLSLNLLRDLIAAEFRAKKPILPVVYFVGFFEQLINCFVDPLAVVGVLVRSIGFELGTVQGNVPLVVLVWQ